MKQLAKEELSEKIRELVRRKGEAEDNIGQIMADLNELTEKLDLLEKRYEKEADNLAKIYRELNDVGAKIL